MDEGVEGSGGGGGGGIGRKTPMGEVELKEKSGTAWSHSFLNQKPWHPLSYPNQRRKWIAEQIHTNRARRDEEVQREFAQEQEFFRQTALFSKKDKEKMEIMKAVSFMYVRPPGYNPESAKAAEIEDEKRKLDHGDAAPGDAAASTSSMPDKELDKTHTGPEKKTRPKDVFGRALPTEQEFEVLKNAPRLDTGAPARAKPFGIEIRNVRCLRCGNFGHQSGDRECPMKDVVMPNEESRLKRDDPLTAIMAQTDSSEPLKWELKQKPGMSPPRGGFNPDDPNQQIVAEDIFDEYGGFLGDIDIPALLTNFSASKSKKQSKSKSRRKQSDPVGHVESGNHRGSDRSSTETEPEKSNRTSKSKGKKKYYPGSSYSDAEVEAGKRKGKQKAEHRHKKTHLSDSSSDSVVEVDTRSHRKRERSDKKTEDTEIAPSSFSRYKGDTSSKRHSRRSRDIHGDPSSSESESSSFSDAEVEAGEVKGKQKSKQRHKKKHLSESSSDSESEVDTRRKREHRKKKTEGLETAPSSFSRDGGDKVSKRHSRRSREKHRYIDHSSSESEWRSARRKDKRYDSDSSSESNRSSKRSGEKRSRNDQDSPGRYRPSQRSKDGRHYTDQSTYESHRRSRKSREKRHYSDSSASGFSDTERHKIGRHRRR